MTTSPGIDLTPFGFTPTESRTYEALLRLGPSSGYALAGALRIARANAYQAIGGLVAKGVAVELPGPPTRVRAVRTDALLALVVTRQGERLELLEQQVQHHGMFGGEGEGRVSVVGRRALEDLATRIIVREEGAIEALVPKTFLVATGPAWRKRGADGRASEVWAYGAGSTIHSPPTAGDVDFDRVSAAFGGPVVLLSGRSNALAASLGQRDARGWWAQDALSIGMTRCAIATAGGV